MFSKNTLYVKRAGKNNNNPLLTKVRKNIVFKFKNPIKSITGYTDTVSPANTKTITFIKINNLKYKIAFESGTEPFNYLDRITYIRLEIEGNNGISAIEKQLYISSRTTDLIQIFNYNNETWEYVNNDYSQAVCEVCGVKILENFEDEFGYKTFGGFKWVSVFDGNSNYSDTSEYYVKRQTYKIEKMRQIHLVKHNHNIQENHYIKFLLKNTEGDTDGLFVEGKIKSLSCYGFLLMNPEY